MEDLNEIISKVKDSVAKNVAMEEDYESKAIVLRDKCIGNYKNIVESGLEMCHNLAKDLAYKYGIWFASEGQEGSEHFTAKYYGNGSEGYYLCISVRSKDYRYDYRPHYYTNHVSLADSIKGIHNPNYKDKIVSFSSILATEDKAEALLSEIYKVYADFFTKALKQVEGENEKLSSQLKTLTDYLSDSHTIEEKEDGTVEIRLGGKTYIGTLKEE